MRSRKTHPALVAPPATLQYAMPGDARRAHTTPTPRSSFPPASKALEKNPGSLRPSPIRTITQSYKDVSGPASVHPVPVASREYRYRLVDVFAEEPFSGSPLAVFTDATGLDELTMRRIARELNRSQTSFVFPLGMEAKGPRVRVFTPHAELTGFRHPGIGTAFALEYEKQLASGAPSGRVVFQAADGPISVSVFARVMTMRHAVPRLGSVCDDVEPVLAMLGLESSDCLPEAPIRAAWGGMAYLVVPLCTQEAIKRIRFRTDIWERTARHWEAPKILACTMATERPSSTCKIRVFAPDVGLVEEAATETACGPLAAYLARYGLIPSEPSQVLVVEQGAEIERPSYMHVVIERAGRQIGSVRVGGQCVSVGSGTIGVAVVGNG